MSTTSCEERLWTENKQILKWVQLKCEKFWYQRTQKEILDHPEMFSDLFTLNGDRK